MKGIPFLIYHQVVDENFDLTSVPVGERPYYLKKISFIQQMEYLFQKGFKTLTLGEFVEFVKNDRRLPTNSIVLTFDDGHISNYTCVYPILREFNFKATFFVIVEKVGKFESLNWTQVVEMTNNGMEIGSHTMTHPFLSDLKEEEVLWELKRSKEILETHLKKEIDFLSIPREHPRSPWLRIARDYGYKAVCTSYVGLNGLKTNLFALKRIGIKDGLSLMTFSRIVNRDRKIFFKLKASDFLKQMLKTSLGIKKWLNLRERLLKTKYYSFIRIL